MANKKISELTAATAPAETDVMPIVQAAATKKATVSAWVRGALLTGLSTATNAAIAATDSVLVAMGKAQAQIAAILTSLNNHVGNTTTAHGMTTAGAAIVQATDAEAQRSALGLANHQMIGVDSAGRCIIGLGALWKPGVQIGTAPYAGMYGPALTYLATLSGGGWVSTGGGTASALTVDEGYLSFATSGGVQSSGTALSWTTRLRIDPDGRAQINGSCYLRDGLRPVVDNNHSIGEATLRFATGYFATNPVIGSDARLKTDIEEIPAAIAADIMQSLRPVTFRYRVGGQEAYEEEEPFEEQVQVTEPVDVPKITIQIVDGKAVQVTTAETVQQPVYDEFPLVDGDGSPVMQLVTPAVLDNKTGEEITPAVYVQAIHREPRLTTVTKARKVTKYREVEGKRYHAGYIAQEVKAALDAVADRWPPAADLAVWLLSDTADSDSTQMVRMEQMIPIIHAAAVWQWQQK